jgi:ATP-dependent RNA helicase RhlE
MASRGLHLDQLPAVVNFDLARSPATHIHRVGRTARQDAAGMAVSFIAADDPTQEAHFRLIEKRQGLRVPREQIPGFEPASQAAELAPQSSQDAAAPRGLDPNGGVKGRRKSRKDKLREAQTAQGHPPSKEPNAHNR